MILTTGNKEHLYKLTAITGTLKTGASVRQNRTCIAVQDWISSSRSYAKASTKWNAPDNTICPLLFRRVIFEENFMRTLCPATERHPSTTWSKPRAPMDTNTSA